MTTAGVVLLVGAILGTWFIGVGHTDLVALVGGFALTAFLMLTVVLVMGGALLLKRGVQKCAASGTLKSTVGRKSETEFSPKLPTWLPFLQFEWHWTGPDSPEVTVATKNGGWKESIQAIRRGEFHNVERRLVVRDSLHIAEISWRWSQEQHVLIYPASGHGQQLALLNNLVSGDEISDPRGERGGDRVDVRQYTKGDTPRTILWKVFARTRKLMVKIPERSVSARPRLCCYLVATYGDEPAASLGRDLLEQGFLGDGWRFGADGTPTYSDTKPDSILAIARSGPSSVRTEPSEINTFLQQAAQNGYGGCFVLLGPEVPNDRLKRVRNFIQTSPLSITLCLVVHDISQPQNRSWLKLSDSNPNTTLEGAVSIDRLQELWTFWTAACTEVRLVCRRNGGVYRDVPALLRALRGAKNG